MRLKVLGLLLFLALSGRALSSSPIPDETQKATGTITSFTANGMGFVLSREANGGKEDMEFFFGPLLEDGIWTVAGDTLTVITRDGKKITLHLGETVTVEYHIVKDQGNVVISVKGQAHDQQEELKSNKESRAASPTAAGSTITCTGTGCQTLLKDLTASGPPLSESDKALLEKAKSGDAFAQFQLAALYAKRGDIFDAKKWTRAAADQGDSHAQNALGYLYQHGPGGPETLTEAASWYRKSAEQGDPNGQANLAKLLFDGTGVPVDLAQAADWYRKSAEQGWAWGQAMLAQIEAKGQGVPVDLVGAYSWCILALPAENPKAPWGCKELLESLSAKMRPEEVTEAKQRSYSWFEQRSKTPNQIHWAVGPEDKFGPSGFLTDEQWLTGAIGTEYARGRGVAPDDVEAVRWFELGSERGDAPAEVFLAERYFLGKGKPKDYARAFTLVSQSAEQGYVYGEENLGVCYLQGIGVQQNMSEAAKWFEKAAEQGSANAQAQLGLFYQYGRGVEKNEAEALKWYQRAVEHENAPPVALNNLAWLYATAGDPGLRDPSKALTYALKAVALTQEKNAGFLDTLAEAKYVSGDSRGAIEAEEKALALEPTNSSFKKDLEKYQQALQPKPQ